MANQRRRTRPTIEPEDDDFDADIFDDDGEDAPVPMNRQARRQRERQARRDKTRRANGIVIDEGQTENIPVRLLEVDYTITPPKVSKFLRMAAQAELEEGTSAAANIEQIEDWVLKAFGEDDGNDVLDRIDDDNDKLDYPHIQKLIQQTMAYATRNPTT